MGDTDGSSNAAQGAQHTDEDDNSGLLGRLFGDSDVLPLSSTPNWESV